MNFHPIKPENIAEIKPFIGVNDYKINDYSLSGIAFWAELYSTEYCIEEGVLYLKGRALNDINKTVYPLPLGENAEKGIENLLKHAKEQGEKEIIFSPIPEEQLPIFSKFKPTVSELEGWADYIYSAQELATLPGHAFQNKRRLATQFLDIYDDAHLEEITNENVAEVILFFEGWQKSRGIEFSGAEIEYSDAKMRDFLQNLHEFEQIGVALYAYGEVVGFTIGEVIGDTLYSHFEMANIHKKGSYQALNMMFAQYVTRKYPIKWINREDDAGSESLRLAKLSYNPWKMGLKFSVMLKMMHNS